MHVSIVTTSDTSDLCLSYFQKKKQLPRFILLCEAFLLQISVLKKPLAFINTENISRFFFYSGITFTEIRVETGLNVPSCGSFFYLRHFGSQSGIKYLIWAWVSFRAHAKSKLTCQFQQVGAYVPFFRQSGFWVFVSGGVVLSFLRDLCFVIGCFVF